MVFGTMGDTSATGVAFNHQAWHLRRAWRRSGQ